ncbi:hypothetical protein X777_12825, partial [Ooceraea biroi]
IAPIDKSSSPGSALKREAGGGCPSSCTHSSTRCNSPDANCPSIVSSCCPSRCGYSQVSSPADCQPCASSLPLKSILKKRNCCRPVTSNHCMCQPMPRGCNCPPPVQVDAPAARECSCDCPSSPECACPPSERRFPRSTTIKCPNARVCCPFPRPSSGPKCHCARCQPYLPPTCDPCTSIKCRGPASSRNSCRPCSPYPSCAPCRPPTPCKKLTFCTQRNNRSSSSCTGTGQSLVDNGNWDNDIYSERDDVEELEQYDAEDCDSSHVCLCILDYTGSKSERIDKSCDPILDEGSVKNSMSKNFINSPGAANPSKSVDPDFARRAVLTKIRRRPLRNILSENLEKDSWHTSSIHVSSYNHAKSDRYTFRGGHSPVDKNMPENSVLARLSNRTKNHLLERNVSKIYWRRINYRYTASRCFPRRFTYRATGRVFYRVSRQHEHAESTDYAGMVNLRK